MSDLALKIAKALHETEIGETCAAGDNQPCSWITEKAEIVDRVLSETQPCPHGARSPEPFWAAHIRKLESDRDVLAAEVERLRKDKQALLDAIAEMRRLAHSVRRTADSNLFGIEEIAIRIEREASTGTGAEVER